MNNRGFDEMIDLARELKARFGAQVIFEFGTASQHYDVYCKLRFPKNDVKQSDAEKMTPDQFWDLGFGQFGPAEHIIQTLRKQIQIREERRLDQADGDCAVASGTASEDA